MIDRIARAIILWLLGRVRHGEIELIEGDERLQLGAVDPGHPLRAEIEVRSPRFYRAALRGSRGLGGAYMDGVWECDDIVTLVRIAALNAGGLDRVRRALRPITAPVLWLLGTLRRNTVGRARRQIHRHYDLGNDLFSLFLDETMLYSCAIFPSPQATLHEAQLAKLDRICEKLALEPSDHLLEIGTGWGGLAVHAATRYGCRVTTTTISQEQHAHAVTRVRAAGVEDRVTVLLEDYRELEGTYDKLASIEMIEAVGWRDFGTYFDRCSALLAPDGVMLLQAITIDDRAYAVEKASRSFITTFIFPGGALPSLEVIGRCVGRRTDMRAVHLEDISAHYAETLRHWRERFAAATAQLEAAGYDERFRRLWRLYLQWCEGGFRERRIRDVQLLLAKPQHRAQATAASLASVLDKSERVAA